MLVYSVGDAADDALDRDLWQNNEDEYEDGYNPWNDDYEYDYDR